MARGRLTLRQLQVLHRHGDRSPLQNVYLGASAHAVEHEAELWESRLPSQKTLDSLASRYLLSDAAPTTNDSMAFMQNRPFGFLTDKGIGQMKAKGEMLAALCQSEGFPLAGMATDDLQIYCNTYTRTQLSVQALLTGMLHGNGHIVPPVHVLPLGRDIIHSYSIYPEIAKLKAQLDKESDALIQRENERARLKTELLSLFPVFSKADLPFYWTTCGDYFYCREAHDLPYLPGTKHLRDETVNHKSFRFHQFYQHRRIRSLVAGNLMDHAFKEMNKVVAGEQGAKKVVIYSGHDVSILAVLHALDADITKAETWWPPYSCALSFELLEDEANQWFVRVRIDGETASLRQLPDIVQLNNLVDIVHDQVDFDHIE